MPRRGDWCRAGLCAGALLGVAEVLLTWADGTELPPRLALLAIAGAALLVVFGCGVASIVARVLGWRPSYSGLVGAVLGPLLAAPAVGRAAGTIVGSNGTGSGAWLGPCLLTIAFAATASVIAARGGDRLERSGAPVSAAPVLLPSAFLVALGEVGGLAERGTGELFGLALVLLGLAALATAGVLTSLRRRVAAWSWGSTLFGVALLALAVAWLPRALPWLAGDPASARLPQGGPTCVLLVDLGEVWASALHPDPPFELVSLALLAGDGVRYDTVSIPTSGSVAQAILAGAGGSDAAAILAARGWATAAVLGETVSAEGLSVAEVDDRPGAGALLAEVSPRISAGLPLRALPEPARERLQLVARVRSPGELSADAGRWLVHWRSARAEAPFLLVVDYRAAAGPGDPAALDRAIARLLGTLEQIGVDDRTLVLVAADLGADDAGAPPERRARVVLRPPIGGPGSHRGIRVPETLAASELGASLAALADPGTEGALVLPGLMGAVDARRLP